MNLYCNIWWYFSNHWFVEKCVPIFLLDGIPCSQIKLLMQTKLRYVPNKNKHLPTCANIISRPVIGWQLSNVYQPITRLGTKISRGWIIVSTWQDVKCVYYGLKKKLIFQQLTNPKIRMKKKSLKLKYMIGICAVCIAMYLPICSLLQVFKKSQEQMMIRVAPVSYTHLTLPTILLV